MMMSPRKRPVRAAIYLRTSVDRSGKGDRIEDQRPICRDLAEREGWEVVEEYTDNDVKGHSRKAATGWARMLADHAAGEIDAVVITDQDRLARGLDDFALLQTLGLKILTLAGVTDLSTAEGVLRGGMSAIWAKAETMRKAERQKRANESRRTRGVPTSGRTPYGYVWVPMWKREERASIEAYELDPERAADVRGIYDAFLSGIPLGSIARDLNQAGKRTLPYKRKIDGERVEVPGAPFTPTTLRRMLMSPYYCARLPIPPEGGWPNGRYDQDLIAVDQTVEGAWPAIVTVAEWEAACARLRHPERKTSPGPTRRWLLSGLAVCGGQGKRDDDAIEARALAATGKSVAEELTTAELAEAAVSLAEERCGMPIRAGGGEAGIHSYRCGSMAHFMRRGDPLDSFIERLIIARLSAPDAADLLVDRERPDAAALGAELTKLEAVRRELGDDRDEGLIGRPEYLRRLKRVDARMGEIRSKLEAGAAVEPLRDLVGVEDVRAAWDALPLGNKRAVIEVLMTVVVHSVGQGNRRNMPDAAMARTLSILWHR